MAKKRTLSILSQLLTSIMILQTVTAFPTWTQAEGATPSTSVPDAVYGDESASVSSLVYSDPTTPVFPDSNNGVTPIFNPDYSKLIGRSDLAYTGRITTGTQGMPIANGRFGGPVWQNSGNTLSMQLNDTDSFMFNDASSASKDHANSGGGAVGRVHVGFGTGTVFNDATKQHLSLYDGKLSINGAGVDVNVIANMSSDAIALQITDYRPAPQGITVDLTMLRDANQVWGNHSAVSTLTKAADNKTVVLEQVIQEPSDTGMAVNDFYNHTAVAATVQGRDVSSVSNSMVGNRQALRLNLPAQSGTFTVIIGGGSTMDKTVDVKARAIANAADSPDYGSIYAATRAWWSDFWQKSYVYLPSQADFEQRRNYYMYLSAISSRGSYPSKYNGGIWIGEEDRRDWGSYYWNWNQDSLYQPLMSANHIDLMEPMFKMRDSSYEQYETAAKQMWGSDGIFIGETGGVLGWETLPDNIADAVKQYYTFQTNTRTQEFTDFTKKRNTFLPAWNWNVFGSGNNQASYVSHTMMATQETAEYYWQVYDYTKDLDWLREQAYPFIKGAAELYDTYPGFKKDADGKYHIYNTNLHEHIWAGKDVIDDLSMARGVFAAAIKSSELLGVDADMRSQWQEILDNLADYPLRTDPGALWAATTDSSMASKLATDKPAFAQGLSPAYFTRDLQGTESPIFKMLEKYDVLNLETRDEGLDNGDWDIALNTYLHSPGYLNQYKNQVIDRNGSSRFHVDAAKLGRADDMEMILNTQYGVFSTNGEHPNLLFDQGDYYSAEGYGTFSAAIQEALNQSLSATTGGEPVIRVFPAWPKAWDAKYKLLGKDGFLVSSSMESGDIQYVEIESQLGGVGRIRSPWDSDIVLYRNGVKAETISATENQLLAFNTEQGEDIVLVRAGTTPDTYRTSDLADSVYTVANDTNKNIAYTGSWEVGSGTEVDYGNDIHYTETDGDSAEFTFYGAGIDYITEMGPDMGEVEVYIDGKLDKTVNCYSEESLGQQTAYVNIGLDYGRHKIKLVKKSGERMIVDAFGIRRNTGLNATTINDNDPGAVSYVNASGATSQANGAWFYTSNRSGEGAYKGDAHISGNASSGGIGNYIEFPFHGTGVAYLTERNNDMGEVRVYLDGEDKGTVTAYKTGGRDSQYPLYSITGLPLGDHTLKLVKQTGQYMIVDAFKVWGPTSDPEVTYIKVDKQPKLTYLDGSALDLSGMEITAAYSDGSMKTLAYNDDGVSVHLTSGEAIENGSALTQAESDSKTLTVSYGGRTAKTTALQVDSLTDVPDLLNLQLAQFYASQGNAYNAVYYYQLAIGNGDTELETEMGAAARQLQRQASNAMKAGEFTRAYSDYQLLATSPAIPSDVADDATKSMSSNDNIGVAWYYFNQNNFYNTVYFLSQEVVNGNQSTGISALIGYVAAKLQVQAQSEMQQGQFESAYTDYQLLASSQGVPMDVAQDATNSLATDESLGQAWFYLSTNNWYNAVYYLGSAMQTNASTGVTALMDFAAQKLHQQAQSQTASQGSFEQSYNAYFSLSTTTGVPAAIAEDAGKSIDVSDSDYGDALWYLDQKNYDNAKYYLQQIAAKGNDSTGVNALLAFVTGKSG
ncbi:glycosyl hydrolase family 95 catalytic domain-containing protein [Paenibacillus glycinis]|uniref:Glycosyl hydrolase family 95 catalytic domain-containing protein n=1 Tax=Paenibacillus glycinis TaxID=2697035 RepID=A0ABW9Y004_9BACL|nr:bacterial Ig-like domain-containing protein [Paenibacillus glycinis]NBD28210.1 hypothetical protein [Paenibacillus glycinis]